MGSLPLLAGAGSGGISIRSPISQLAESSLGWALGSRSRRTSNRPDPQQPQAFPPARHCFVGDLPELAGRLRMSENCEEERRPDLTVG
jgi:hypothetical protein